jgi:hypothetical protein
MEQGKYSQKTLREKMEHSGSLTLPLLMETVAKLFDILESSSALYMAHELGPTLIAPEENTSVRCMQKVIHET